MAGTKVSLWLDPQLWEEAKRQALLSRRQRLSDIVASALRTRLGEWKRQEIGLGADGGIKAFGQDFPPRPTEIRTGRPLYPEQDESQKTRVTVVLDSELAEQWRDALYWQGFYLSYETQRAIADYLDALKS